MNTPVNTVLRRTFAAKYARGEERDRLNRDALTSEYMTSHRYLVRVPYGPPEWGRVINHTFPTKAEAEDYLSPYTSGPYRREP